MKPPSVKRKWSIHTPDPVVVSAIAEAHDVSPLMATIMANRGITSDTAEKYLSPTLSTMYNPSLLQGMDAAAVRFADAIIGGESCTCFLDFDADGCNAGAILLRFGRMVGCRISSYVPDRITEGYGLNEEGLRSIKAAGSTLVITVDLGVTAIEEARLCRELGMDLIITDHHALNADGVLPDAVAVVNPHIPSPYPFQHLCGAGVAFALVVATRKTLRDRGYFVQRPEPKITELLPLVALATIGDLVELRDENRLFVTHGLKAMYSIPGLKALAQVAGLDLATPPSAGQVAFRLAPRINASGRMDSAAIALELLITDDVARAEELAAILDGFNQERQAAEQHVVAESLAMIEADPSLLERKTIVLSGDHPQGVVGIAASRLIEIYHRPTIIISVREDGTGKGSCRSISGFHMRDALDKCSSFLIGFGGHPMAAGLSLQMSDLDAFRDAFEAAASFLTQEDLQPVTKIDAELGERDICVRTVDDLARLEPFGMKNSSPVFCVRQAEVVSVSPLKDKHLKLNVKIGGSTFTALGWGMIERQADLSDCVDLAFTLDVNEWRGKRTVQLELKDFM